MATTTIGDGFGGGQALLTMTAAEAIDSGVGIEGSRFASTNDQQQPEM